jgi:hypothetical protein
MNKIPAEYTAKWINYLSGIESALQTVKDLRPCVPHEVWQEVWAAQIHARGVRDQLMIFAVQDVVVEEEPVRTVKTLPGSPTTGRDVDVVPLVMAAE